MSIYCSWRSDMCKLTCYELQNEGTIFMPWEWKDGKKYYPYGVEGTIKGLAKFRKDHMNEKLGWGNINYQGEPCKRCQIEDKCKQGFPSFWKRLLYKLIGEK